MKEYFGFILYFIIFVSVVLFLVERMEKRGKRLINDDFVLVFILVFLGNFIFRYG